MYSVLNFTYLCDDHAKVWSSLCLVMDCTEENLSMAWISHSENCANVLVNAGGMLPLFAEKSNPCVRCEQL